MNLALLFDGFLEMEVRLLPVLALALAVRFLLKKAPAACSCLLWWGVFLRLACPFFVPAPVQPPAAAATDAAAVLPAPFPLTPAAGNAAPVVINLSEPVSRWLELELLAVLWLAGMAGILLWNLLTYLRFRRSLVGAVRLRDNIWLGDDVPVPVVVGLFRPKIYLPSALEGRERDYVLLHEESHIRRRDPFLKLLGCLMLAVHWPHPLVWIAFLWAARDMEAACDECVLEQMGEGVRQEYSASILSLAAGRRIPIGSLALGESGEIKGRIRRVLEYKRPSRWTRGIAAAAVAVVLAFAILRPGMAKAVPAPAPARTVPDSAPALVPYDTFYFSLDPEGAEVYRGTIALTEISDFRYQVNWEPMGLDIEVVLGAGSGAREGSDPSYLAVGRGGAAGGVFEEVPAGEYTFIIRNAAGNREYEPTTSRENLIITGAAGFGWQEGGEWQRATGSQLGTITFPAYQDGRKDYNAAVYDIEPFKVALALPEDWSVRVPPEEERGPSFGFTPLWLYQGEEYAGSIQYNTFEIYPDVPADGFYRMVYNQLMLGSGVNWDNDYTVVGETDTGTVATVMIMERQGDGSAASPTELRPGILAYDRDRLVYVAIDLQNGRLSSQEVFELASSLEFLPTE